MLQLFAALKVPFVGPSFFEERKEARKGKAMHRCNLWDQLFFFVKEGGGVGCSGDWCGGWFVARFVAVVRGGCQKEIEKKRVERI